MKLEHEEISTDKMPPFDSAKLDRLMEEAGLDLLVVTSKHNVQYMLDRDRAIFFNYMDALGTSRYLPIVIYPKGHPEKTVFIGHWLERHERTAFPPWVPVLRTSSQGSLDAISAAVDEIKKAELRSAHIGIEAAFLPFDAGIALRQSFPDSEITDALFVVERLRAVKSPQELAKLRCASEMVVASMLDVVGACKVGVSKREIVDALCVAEARRGLTFEYCLIACGVSHNRAATSDKWLAGDVLSLDSGGNYQGYIGDVARMAIAGEPDAELSDLLAEVDAIQQAAFAEVKAGMLGGNMYSAAEKALRGSPNYKEIEFLAHGMGLVSHEAPRLTGSGPVAYDGYDVARPLEEGMVVSIETTMKHPRRGFIKLEDTLAVTAAGYDLYGEAGRGWNRSIL